MNIKTSTNSNRSQWRAEDVVVGNVKALEALRELIEFPLSFSQFAQSHGLKLPRGLLLYGPPGSGKKSLVRAVVREFDAHLTVINCHSIEIGESGRTLGELFAEASSHALDGKPSIILIDEIDFFCRNSDSRSEKDARIASRLGFLMEKFLSSSVPRIVLAVASTNKIGAVDRAFIAGRRFHLAVEVPMPTKEERYEILKLYSRKLSLDPNVNLRCIAASCNGYAGADLKALCGEAASHAQCRDINGESFILNEDDWREAKTVVQPKIPSAGAVVEIPKVSWDDIGGYGYIKSTLKKAVEWPITHAGDMARYGILPVRGVLLHGPPGCAKNTLAKAAAHGAQAHFFHLSCAALFSMYVGEGEALMRDTFKRAKLVTPSVIFLDEADVVLAKRSNDNAVGGRLVTTLLTEMDGVEEMKGVVVIAATNRPHAIDAALLRPGRFNPRLYVGPPDLEGRYEILRVHTRRMTLGMDVDLRRLAGDTELSTGAELEGLCNRAGTLALREDMSATTVYGRHFKGARDEFTPALTPLEIQSYSSFGKSKPPPPRLPPVSSQASRDIFRPCTGVAR